jgi:hypothetical protein
MLNKPCFVTKSVVTILPHAMEVGLVLTVIAASESAVFIEPESHVSQEKYFGDKIRNCRKVLIWFFHVYFILVDKTFLILKDKITISKYFE